LKIKRTHEFGNPTDGSRWDSAVVAFISQTSSKLGRDSPAAAAAFEPSPAFQSREGGYVVVSVAAATVDTGAGINRRCGDWEQICVSRPGFEKPG